MQLHRYALLNFAVPFPEVATWGYTTREGVEVVINNVQGSKPARQEREEGPTIVSPVSLPHSAPTQILLQANIKTPFEAVQPAQIRLPDPPREAAERALSEMAGVLGILAESQWTLTSPRPYMMVSAETSSERRTLRATERVILPPPKIAPPFHGQGLRQAISVAELLSDRPDGVLLLGAATRAGHGVPKLHELFRVLENGFGCAGERLIHPLTTFLQSYPSWDMGYSTGEIAQWVRELRNPATHADLARSRRIAYDSDVERHLFRIEQAAYDVLFNKKSWTRPDTDREMRWAFSAAQRPDGHCVIGATAVLRSISTYDHYETFPLTEAIRLNTDQLPDGWLAADWYFSDEQWARFGGTEAD